MKPDKTGRINIATRIQKMIAQGDPDTQKCSHLNAIQDVTPSAEGCEKCLQSGDTWVNLRLCLTCGHVGCCDNSKNKHASKHYRETHHPIIVSFEAGEDWLWCYPDEIMFSQ